MEQIIGGIIIIGVGCAAIIFRKEFVDGVIKGNNAGRYYKVILDEKEVGEIANGESNPSR